MKSYERAVLPIKLKILNFFAPPRKTIGCPPYKPKQTLVFSNCHSAANTNPTSLLFRNHITLIDASDVI